MPNIPVFEAGSGALQIPEGGASAFQQVGRRSGQFYRQIGEDVGQGIQGIGAQVEQHDTMMAISKGAAAGTGLHASLTQQAAKAIGDNPEDSTAPQRFLQETAEPAIQNFLQQFDSAPPRAKEWAMNYADNMRQQVSAHVAALGSFASGQVVEQNARVTANNLQNQVMAQGTVGAYNSAVGTYGGIVDELVAGHPNLSGEDRVKLKTTLMQKFQEDTAKNLLSVTALKNPDAAEKMLDSGAFGEVLNAGEVRAGIQQIARQNKADATNARILQNQIATQRSQAAAGQLISQILTTTDPDTLANLTKSVAQLSHDGTLKPSEAMQVASFSQAQAAKSEKREEQENFSPVVYGDLYSRVGSTTNPTTFDEVNKAWKENQIDKNQAADISKKIGVQQNALKAINTNPIVKNQFSIADGMIQQQNFPTNGAVVSAKAQFRADVLKTLSDAAQNGVDWQRVYLDPHSPDYLFTPERVKQYYPTPEEIQKGLVERSMGGGAPAAQGRPAIVFPAPNFKGQ